MQEEIVNLPLTGSAFVEGPAGAGKTTAAVARLRRMIDEGVPAGSILVLAPQRTLLRPYTDVLRSPATPAGSEASVLTVGGLAQRMVELFWPVVAGPAGLRTARSPADLPHAGDGAVLHGAAGRPAVG